MEKKIKVLIVDDEEDFANTLAERLTLRGFDVKVETDGQRALSVVAQAPPDVLVLDVKMPGLGGFEILRRIKVSHPKVPVILLTGHGSTRDGVKGMELGAYDYLVKPVDLEVLMERMESALADTKA